MRRDHGGGSHRPRRTRGLPHRSSGRRGGHVRAEPFLDHGKADADGYDARNRAIFVVAQGVAHKVATRGGGFIVNIGSIWAREAVKTAPSSAFSMTKAGLHSRKHLLAMELAEGGNGINSVSPVVVVTPICGALIEPAAKLGGAYRRTRRFLPTNLGRPR